MPPTPTKPLKVVYSDEAGECFHTEGHVDLAAFTHVARQHGAYPHEDRPTWPAQHVYGALDPTDSDAGWWWQLADSHPRTTVEPFTVWNLAGPIDNEYADLADLAHLDEEDDEDTAAAVNDVLVGAIDDRDQIIKKIFAADLVDRRRVRRAAGLTLEESAVLDGIVPLNP
jgi:hypothetical protein